MARLVKKEHKSPVEVKANKSSSILVCMCGLSNNQPFCDDSHKKYKMKKMTRPMYTIMKAIELRLGMAEFLIKGTP